MEEKMNKTQFNRTLVLMGFMLLAGWLAYLQSKSVYLKAEGVMSVLGVVGPAVTGYVIIKGKGGSPGAD